MGSCTRTIPPRPVWNVKRSDSQDSRGSTFPASGHNQAPCRSRAALPNPAAQQSHRAARWLRHLTRSWGPRSRIPTRRRDHFSRQNAEQRRLIVRTVIATTRTSSPTRSERRLFARNCCSITVRRRVPDRVGLHEYAQPPCTWSSYSRSRIQHASGQEGSCHRQPGCCLHRRRVLGHGGDLRATHAVRSWRKAMEYVGPRASR
jgi:hypothetical protein